ncbi:hypothetical protein HX001_06520 [Empedobacter brevis]|uniref:Uncharacterized protein n=1 Tax=Empedobacter brevis TaxID=247 RepID=A0AAJ1QDN2_9FLAO|nr:hypothetical protein [Empedobacter brevis]MDM1072148.1 hypothetical protein [Empedobacter brevis]
MSKKYISNQKKSKILTYNFLNKTYQGEYFKEKHINFNYNISEVRNAITPDNYSELINVLDLFSKNENVLLFNKIDLNDFFKNIVKYKNFNSEFLWCKSIISKNINRINLFIRYRDEYSNSILIGNYDNAAKVLDLIENEFGDSVWLVKNRISFYQLTEGLERQKNYTNSIKERLEDGSLEKFLVHWISVRNENNTSVNKFKNQISFTLNRLNEKTQIGFKEYLEFHLYEKYDFDIEKFIHVIRLSYSTSIIDYYESFTYLLGLISINNCSHKIKMINFLNREGTRIDDYILNNLKKLFIDNSLEEEIHLSSNKIYDFIVSGENDKALTFIKNNFEKNKGYSLNIIMYIELSKYLKSSNFLIEDKYSEADFLKKIISSLEKIYINGVNGALKEYNELQKIILNFGSLTWSSSIKILLNKEQLINEFRVNNTSIEVLRLESLHPIGLEFIDNSSFYEIYQKTVSKNNPNDLGIILNFSENNNTIIDNDKFVEVLKLYINSLISYKKKDYNLSIELANKLLSFDIPFYNRKAYGIISHANLSLSNYKELLLFIVDVYLKHKNSYSFLPLNELCSIIKPKTEIWKESISCIELSIFFDICIKHLVKDEEFSKILVNNRRYAYEDFLETLDIERPSLIKANEDCKFNNKLYYFFNFICQENTMDLSGLFEGGSTEILDERLKLCRILLENDQENKVIYKQEISDLVRRQVITSRRKEVDQSRVYVDIKSIKEWAEVELAENYSRLISYIISGLSRLDNAKKVTQDNSSVIYIPNDEVNDLFLNIVDEIKSSYLSSDIGLDRFISTRIRHGELERTLRIPIQKHHLITKRESKEGPYLKNEYWLNKISDDSNILSKIDTAFNVFSEKFDTLSSEMSKDWLQLKTKDKTNGLFDFNFTINELNRLFNLIEKDTSLKQFIDFVISFLDNKLVYELLKIQEVLNNEGKDQAKALLGILEEEIFINNGLVNYDLKRAINTARTDLALQFDKIIEWFIPSTDGSSTPYTVEDALLVAEAIIKEAESNFSININQNNEQDYTIHGQLPMFVDVFINIFDNIVKRSGLENPTANIILNKDEIDEEHFQISMSISNELGSSININSVKETLEVIKKKLDNNNYSEDVAKDNKSGLIKIFKTISDFTIYESNIEANMDFDILDDKFVVNITIPLKLYIIDRENIKD